MKEQNIAIIGGAGFVGSRLARYFDRKNLKYLIYDINTKLKTNDIVYLNVEDSNTFDCIKGSSSIINLAAEHRDDVRPLTRYDDVNVQGAVNICEAASEYGIQKIIFTSSVAIYGFSSEEIDEDGVPNYFNDYGRTKFLAEGIYKKWQEEDPQNRTLVIIRPTVIFGEGNRGNVYNLLKQIASGKFVMFGNGKNKKSMAYVENVAAFLDYSLKFKPGIHTYNYIDKPDLNMNNLVSATRKILFNKDNIGLRLPSFIGIMIGHIADIISYLTNRQLPISSIRVKKFMGNTQFLSATESSGFIAPVSLEDGLSRTIRYEFVEENSHNRTFNSE